MEISVLMEVINIAGGIKQWQGCVEISSVMRRYQLNMEPPPPPNEVFQEALTTRTHMGNRSFGAVSPDTFKTVMVFLGCYLGEVGVPLTWHGNFHACGGNQRHRRNQKLEGFC